MRRYLIVVAAVAVTFAIICIQAKKIVALKDECNRGYSNVATLMSSVATYKIRDSLNCATIESLRLTVDEYKKYRAEDAEIIKSLRVRNRDLQAITKTQTSTLLELSAVPRDTIVIRDSIPLTAMVVHAGDAWFDFEGVLTKNDFMGTLHVRDSLMVVETVKYKRFLGFLWKTRKIKNRKVDIMSKNPHVTISGIEHVTIED